MERSFDGLKARWKWKWQGDVSYRNKAWITLTNFPEFTFTCRPYGGICQNRYWEQLLIFCRVQHSSNYSWPITTSPTKATRQSVLSYPQKNAYKVKLNLVKSFSNLLYSGIFPNAQCLNHHRMWLTKTGSTWLWRGLNKVQNTKLNKYELLSFKSQQQYWLNKAG